MEINSATCETGKPAGNVAGSPCPVKRMPAAAPSERRQTIVEGVLEDMEQHIALREAFKTLMGA